MKKMVCVLMVLSMALVLTSCAKKKENVPSGPDAPEEKEDPVVFVPGLYLLEGKESGPCVVFDAETKLLHSSFSVAASYAARGTYEVNGGKITGTAGTAEVLEYEVLSGDRIRLTKVQYESGSDVRYDWLHEGDVYVLYRWTEPKFGTVDSADKALEWSKQNPVTVTEDAALTSGKEIMEKFYEDSRNGIPSVIVLASYYTLDKEHVSQELYEEEKDQYPKLFFRQVEYNGTQYIVHTRDCTKEEIETAEGYMYLLHFTGDNPVQAKHRHYEAYVLVDDAETTWEKITWSMVSSQSTDWVRHHTVLVHYFD